LRHAWYEESKAAYALRALPEDERLAFESHLADHPELREEVERLISLTELLALACEEHDPPPRLRSELLSQIEDGVPRSSAKERLRGLVPAIAAGSRRSSPDRPSRQAPVHASQVAGVTTARNGSTTKGSALLKVSGPCCGADHLPNVHLKSER